MAAASRASDRAELERYVKEEIRRLTEHDTRDRMKLAFDRRVEESEWFKAITSRLDKSTKGQSVKPYDELLLEAGGPDMDNIEPTTQSEVTEKIITGLVKSEKLQCIKDDIFKEWDEIRQVKNSSVT